MFVWKHSEEVRTVASASEIWELWKQAPEWPRWDRELAWVRVNGDFVNGTTGILKPVAGPEMNFTLDKVIINKSFINVAKLPLTKLVFGHEYLPPVRPGDIAKIKHTVTMTGLLAPVFGRVIGARIRLHLREAMLELSRLAPGSCSW